MQNIEMDVKDKILTIKIDLSQKGELSKSGKSFVIATTSGNTAVPDNKNIKIGINVFTKNNDYKEE